MTCKDYQNQISLFLYEELAETDKPGLESHLQACDSCRHAFEEEKGLHMVLAEDAAAFDMPSDLLVESRGSLADVLDQVERKRSWWKLPSFSVVLTPMRLLESAALVAMGLAIGVYVTNLQNAARQAQAPSADATSVASSIPANSSVANLRIVSANPSTGEIELAGEVVQPLRLQGKMKDDTVQQLVVGTLANATNAGSRLRAAEVLGQNAQGSGAIKQALMQALVYDENPGVRLKALHGLKAFANETDVQAVFLHTLENDTDAGIRVEAIESLTRTQNANLAKALEPFTRDGNSYISMKALQFVGTNHQ